MMHIKHHIVLYLNIRNSTCTANCLNTIDFDRDNSMDYFVNKEAFYVKIENESFSAHKTVSKSSDSRTLRTYRLKQDSSRFLFW